jgi:mono/diheme cytochrome c family protein
MRQAGMTAAVLLLMTAAVPVPAASAPVSRGELIYRVAGCENCHTDRENKGARLAGGRKLATPLGVFYAPNITPDNETGIGRWREQDFVRALRDGISPDGTHYYPSFPYTSYTRLTDEDLRALWAYLRAQPAVRQPNRAHELPWYLGLRALLAGWKWLYFTPGAYTTRADMSAEWNRGAYLAEALAHCGECHTPRNALGGFRKGYYLAGTSEGPEGGVIPNITTDKKTGIGRWRASELVEYLESGMTPDGDFAGDLMAEVIDNGLKFLTPGDRKAIAAYVFAQPPVEHAVRREKKKKKDESEF